MKQLANILGIFVALYGFTFAANQSAPLLIVTPAYNHPDFIEVQYSAFQCFSEDQYEFMVFNDAQDPEMVKQITEMCLRLNIPCIRVPQENREVGPKFSWASWRHGQAINYMMQTVGFSRNGNVMLIDSDMFPIKNFSVKAFLGNYPIGGVQQGPRDGRTEYLWAGLMFFNMTALPNNHTMSFLPYVQGGIALDSAGSLFQYFENNPTVKKLYAPQETCLMIDENWDPYYVYACPEKYRYLQCAGCDKHDFKNRYFPDLVVAKKPQKFVCSHSRKILQELGFSDILLDLVQQKKFLLIVNLYGEIRFFMQLQALAIAICLKVKPC